MNYDELFEKITAIEGDRVIIAIAGAPASGKSTLAEGFAAKLGGAVLAQDGFHYDDALLEARGIRARKGAHFTFDNSGLLSTLKRVHANEEAEIAIPVFDRALEISRGSAAIIPQSTRYVFLEGNYILMDLPIWEKMRNYFYLSIYLDVPEGELTKRLEARWRHFEYSEQALRAKIEENDLPNAREVMASKHNADVIYRFHDVE